MIEKTKKSKLFPVKLRGRRRAVAGGMPRYKAVKMELVRVLSSGERSADDPLPTERQLAARHKVSVGTIRRAMDELVAEHVVVRQQGRGTFLAPFSPERLLNRFWPVFRRGGGREIPIVQTVRFEKGQADAEAALALGIDEGARILRIRNLLLIDGAPVLLDDVRLSRAMFPGLSEERFVARENTMYGFYGSEYGISVIRVIDHLHAVAADMEASRVFRIPAGSPLLESVRIAYTFRDRPVELRRTLIHSKAYEYRNVIGGEI